MEKERHVLVIFPHPDDEAFGVSGTISLHIDNGTPVTYACLTLGEMGRNMGNPPFATRETLPKIRKEELEEAARVLGIQDLRMLGYRDKTVEFEDEEKLANRLGVIIGETNPSLIITFYPGYAVHPDHDATGAAVIRAVKELPADKRPKVHCVAFSNNCEEEIGQADIVNDVSAVADRKVAAIKAHASQTQLMAANMEESIKKQEPEVLARMYKERFWTYKF
ncbi:MULTISPECIES: bacillithiol biosynthesis deacetylase BshB2 [Cytobacillus]|jgi:bacillithiol biosynthesis deacetylase BshB2|uniref:Bacillithiol biosynthesis deacetylase BshB2 n=2 Tax=Cytobacillus TaxID=2675230 RepID=A0A160MI82_9BACI|nr:MULTISPECIES: bacillithiol biosynthesis deacetylase BshB2 [Cytobacillus]AND42854.1 bacillithiol biosynthesis deacetylase BshB2 [Cytobacillus oceanisediminis 2691]MBU8730666.1 bacillithiol biosynthesis deacetylase BshB2 [Cytobacillus oceanisediminis]MBU8772491.1 bacillithiol biosynthesis deacetylase BshB2 [Cytobacillus oceanisediminis]MBY0157814.1 bacillithiol biosynthesis deacetylase BshB2 [Cytobacillus firmus]MCM3243861.1 bacillithiol biosynthesis deacetylase BshB2 [Cytobacillus oceanisedi